MPDSAANRPGAVPDVPRLVEAVARENASRIHASLIRACGGDFQLAEDALQDALVTALERWPRDGVPARPEAWIITTARHRAIDRLRRGQRWERAREQLEYLTIQDQAAEQPQPQGATDLLDDDRLRLIFTCCHPALALEAQVALTLRTVAGLDVADIAHAFLVSPDTMAKRLTRARTKIRDARIPYRVPAESELPNRLNAALSVVYLIYNEGYLGTASPTLARADLADEAIRLGRLMAALMPDEAEVLGLLALMLLNDSRRAARTDAAGDLVTIEEQDRALWDHGRIADGLGLIDRAARMRRPGPFQVQAAIAALHAEAPTPEETDWRQIVRLYGELYRMEPNAVVALNRAAAVGMAFGPEEGLHLMAELTATGELDGYYLLPAARADLLRRAERPAESAHAYREALALCTNPVETRYLQRRLSELDGAHSL